MEYLKQIYTISELKLMACASVMGALFSATVGGIDKQVLALVCFVIADYVTGMMAAWKHKIVSSRIGFKGVYKKIAILAGVALAHWVDIAMATDTLRSMALFGFAVVEVTSLLENIDRLGYGEYIPTFIRAKLIQIREEKGLK